MSGADTGTSGTRHRTRHRAREAAVQMLYQCEVGQSDIEEVLRTFWSANLPGSEGAPESVRTFAEQLVRSTIGQSREDRSASSSETAEHWRLSRMAALDRIILRLAISEFLDGVDASQCRHQRSARAGQDVQRRGVGEVRQRHPRRREEENAMKGSSVEVRQVRGFALACDRSCGRRSPAPRPDLRLSHPTFSVLVFSKTAGFRHDSIPAGIAADPPAGQRARVLGRRDRGCRRVYRRSARAGTRRSSFCRRPATC